MKVSKLRVSLGALALLSFVPLVGCAKSDCNIKDAHVHRYVSDDGLSTSILSEDLNYYKGLFGYSWHWTSDLEYISHDEIEKHKVLNGFFDGRENWDFLFKSMLNNKDYIKYQYEYTEIRPLKVGEITIYQTSTSTSYHFNANDSSNTGEFRVYHTKYFGYKLEQDENGKYYLVRSPAVDDIREIINEYPYFDPKNYTESWYIEGEVDNKSELPYLRTDGYFSQPDRENSSLDGFQYTKTVE